MTKIKDNFRKLLVSLPFAVTKNIAVDQLTFKVIKKYLKVDSNCIDVGCHKGEIMDYMLKCAPSGEHYGFEPIPFLYDNLIKKYQGKVKIFPYALSDVEGQSNFNLVTTNPAYSGLIKRKYDKEESDTSITVDVKKLDDLIDSNIKIDFIKIDTEGGEFGVLKGGAKIIQKYKPIILFEHGMGASEFYGTKPEMIFDFFESMEMSVYLLSEVVKKVNKKSMSKSEFSRQFYEKLNYIFVAK